LNSDALTRTTPSRWRVYLFHHLGTLCRKRYGRSERTRTPDRRFWRPLLYQLSYTPAPFKLYFIIARGRKVITKNRNDSLQKPYIFCYNH
jgi:hypothetical protein